MAIHCHNTPGLPDASLSVIRDMILLALDALAQPDPTGHGTREAASYLRHALRIVRGAA